ncbi:hypothetical protein IFM89_010227, partial [Coptis chinensis]
MEEETCLDCLEREIKKDFSDKLIFSYGISSPSYTALPFASSALVQTSSEHGEVPPHFQLVRIPDCTNDCLTNYIDSFCSESLEHNEYVHHCKSGHGKFSCDRTITALAPLACIRKGSYAELENIARNYLSGTLEEHVISSVSNLVEGKPTGRDAVNFLSLIGVPSFDEDSVPGCLRHPNIAPVLGVLKTDGYSNVVIPKAPYTLENVLHFSLNALESEWNIRFLVYQILSALAYLHSLGIAHGNLCPSSVMLSDLFWVWLSVFDKPRVKVKPSLVHDDESLRCSTKDCPCRALYADLKLPLLIDWPSDFKRWWNGEISNYDYLLVLNRLAGRRWGDHTFHTVMPWVIDFSLRPDESSDVGWRDLEKSKWRLAKGNEQLDFTYSTSEVPHHVSDECLSELAVCSYKARRLPLSILRTAVRSVYEPNEYPSNMQRLYQWTPDECIPEFYHDPRIFTSLHPGMNDLAVPPWANSPEEFIKLHRDALESNHVSEQIHHWIDITFGYKMSGQAAVAAKNVMLPSSEPTMLRSVGRRQLFTRPHPMRRVKKTEYQESLCFLAGDLQDLEEAASFCEDASYLSPIYHYHQGTIVDNVKAVEKPCIRLSNPEISEENGSAKGFSKSSDTDSSNLVEYFEVEDNGSMGFQELSLWKQKLSEFGPFSEDIAADIFSAGCILAELHLKRPLFNMTSFTAYLETGILPGLMQELPPNVALLVEACIQREWRRRPSVKCLLESPYFTATIRSSYLFIAPLHLLVEVGYQLQYAAKFARQGSLNAMGASTAELCAPHCLALLVSPLSDTKAEWAYILLKEFLKCLKPQAVKSLVLPAIQKILQAADYSHLKVSLLQDSFMREIWTKIGKEAYLEMIHPLVIFNLSIAPHKNSSSAASVLLMGCCDEFGVPVTVHQTLLPLIHSFGKGLCADGIDVLVRIGSLMGDSFIVKHILPFLRNVVLSSIDVSNLDKPEPIQSWNALAVIDSLVTLDGLAAVLAREVVIRELVQDRGCLHVKVLMQTNLELPVLQVLLTLFTFSLSHL